MTLTPPRWPALPRAVAAALLMCAALLHAHPGHAQTPPDAGPPTDDALAEPTAEPAAEPTAEPIAAAPADAGGDVERKLNDIFTQVEAMRGLTAKSRRGVVTLTGQTASARTKDRAVTLAERIEGVIYVQDLIELAPTEAPAQAPAITERTQRDEAIAAQLQGLYGKVESFKDIQVQVEAGVVHLSGEVYSARVSEEATALAKKLDGVLYVDERMEETTDLETRVPNALSTLQGTVKRAISGLPLFGLGLALFLALWWLARWISNLDWLYTRLSDRPLMEGMLRQGVRTLIFLGGGIFILDLFDLTAVVGAIAGTAGVLGIALGFAFRDIVENYLASIFLSVRHPFSRGDLVKIGDHVGKIMRMTGRDTVLMTYDGNHLRVPNAEVFKSVILNYSHNPQRRFDFVVGVGTGESLLEARRVGLEALNSIDGVLASPEAFMLIDELGDSTVNCHFYAWVDQRASSFGAVRTEGIRRVKVALEKADFDLPEPIHRVVMYQTEAAAMATQPRSEEALEADTILDTEGEERQIDQQMAADAQARPEGDLLTTTPG